ncbi:hypothetical protein DPMN_122562 [Dreissena polymorpha]|uniref:Transmembrane protein n=1 Tax=Dreissena polymorpha TaxID=45954 RepID=A0A9D4GS47_DREPO|nr:hypothetical protein DPMN_122562 [Dreissena polymorpha]
MRIVLPPYPSGRSFRKISYSVFGGNTSASVMVLFNHVSHPQTMSLETESRKFQKLAFLLALVTLWMLRLATVMLFVRSLLRCFFLGLEQRGVLLSNSCEEHEDLDILEMLEM